MSYKVGLIGLAGAGKDTVAVILQEALKERGQVFEIDRYAGLLKEAARQVFGENFDDRNVKEVDKFVDLYLADKIIDATDYVYLKLNRSDIDLDEWNDLCQKHIDSCTWMSPRKFQQLLGTEVGRAIDPNIWVNYLKNQDRNLIIPDVRFGNEDVDFNILITRHPVPQGKLHASEVYAAELQLSDNPYDYVDYVIHNDGSIEDLKRKVQQLVNKIKI
ncbi:dNMP kinase [Acinetobacter phage vB_AbaP_AS11]|uniref:DNMP kinase n=1 Tax=Acinetobacter phage vB_AbaP_AS11 TaxID=1932886 RepID=A0A218KS12_9CAUD|nr:dNMP kinase [Acinetobacter phage vB_AbaP_AS11]AQN32683.1 dNMP kinase [Acinetobacter phage vB_AbaP_AS11]ULG00657.1 dNMP kinase [Acinetobacter phage vB_AbaP_PE21]